MRDVAGASKVNEDSSDDIELEAESRAPNNRTKRIVDKIKNFNGAHQTEALENNVKLEKEVEVLKKDDWRLGIG